MDTPPLKRNTKRISPAITHYTFIETPVGLLLIAGANEIVMLNNFPTGSQAMQPWPEWLRDDYMFSNAKQQFTERKRMMAQKLNPGDIFPEITLHAVGGDEIQLPGDLDSPMTIVLFFRGHW